MPFLRKYRRLFGIWQLLRLWCYGLLAVAAVVALWGWLAQLGPRRIEGQAPVLRTEMDPMLRRLADEITELENHYVEVARTGVVTEEALTWVSDALNKQRELLRLSPAAGIDQTTRLARLEAEFDNARVEAWNRRVEQRVQDAEDELAAGRAEAGQAAVAEALSLQRQVNGTNAHARLKNFAREATLRQQLDLLEAAPLARELEAALIGARRAAAEQRWADALAAYVAAREAQTRINGMYPRTRYADLAGPDRLAGEIASLNAGGLAGEIEAKEKAGDLAAEAGDSVAAAAHYAAAQALQIEINQQFRQSRFVSSSRVDALEVKRQSRLSDEWVRQAAALDATIAGLLRRRQVVAAEEAIGRATSVMNELFTRFPKSNRLDASLRIKLGYLNVRRGSLREIQDHVHAGLVPLPGVQERLMSRTEVPQGVYALVMGTNPSRNAGRTSPVDSVNWHDADEFCLRLGWVLGRPVRLPTEDEFRIAVGDPAEGGVWSSENAAERSRETGQLAANGAGFHDLLGNLAEWLQPAAGEERGSPLDRAPLAGGSYLEPIEQLRRVPVPSRDRTHRARYTGFRFVVLAEDEAARLGRGPAAVNDPARGSARRPPG